MSKLIPLALAYIMFTLGLGLRLQDFLAIKEHKKAFFTGLTNQLILVPLVFLTCVLILQPTASIAFGLMLISFCPGGVTSNLFSKMINGNVALSIALTGVVSLLSVFTLPILTATAYQAFFHEPMAEVSIMGLGIKLFVLTTIPVLLGMTLRHFFTNFINNYQKAFSKSATIAFILVLIATIITQKTALINVFSSIGIILPMISLLLLVLSIAITKLLKLSTADKYTLAIETSVQNGSVGMAVAVLIASSAQGLPEFALPSLLYGLLMNAIVIPFVFLQKKRRKELILV